MSDSSQTLRINATVEIAAGTLEAIVENARRVVGRDEKGHYRVDTAGKVGEMISRFLAERDFDAYARDIANFPR